MGLGTKRRFTGLIENDLERHAPVDTVAQYLCIYEEADDIFYFNPVAVRNRYADANILLSGIALQQSLEARQQCHEEGRALALGLALQAYNQRGRQHKSMARGAIIRFGWPGTIGGKLQYGVFFSQLIAPVGQLPLFLSRFQPVALP